MFWPRNVWSPIPCSHLPFLSAVLSLVLKGLLPTGWARTATLQKAACVEVRVTFRRMDLALNKQLRLLKQTQHHLGREFWSLGILVTWGYCLKGSTRAPAEPVPWILRLIAPWRGTQSMDGQSGSSKVQAQWVGLLLSFKDSSAKETKGQSRAVSTQIQWAQVM
jgi:hypothetical protein